MELLYRILELDQADMKKSVEWYGIRYIYTLLGAQILMYDCE